MTLDSYKGKLSKANPEEFITKLVEFRKKEQMLCGRTDSFYRAYWLQQCVELALQVGMFESILTDYWEDLPDSFKNKLIGSYNV